MFNLTATYGGLGHDRLCFSRSGFGSAGDSAGFVDRCSCRWKRTRGCEVGFFAFGGLRSLRAVDLCRQLGNAWRKNNHRSLFNSRRILERDSHIGCFLCRLRVGLASRRLSLLRLKLFRSIISTPFLF